MNLATANTVGNSATAFVTARNTGSGVQGVQTQNLSQSDAGQRVGEDFNSFAQSPTDTKDLSPYVARYPTVAFSFNEDASRLIMLFRDPDTGKTVSQIPSEVVVKQYKDAQLTQRRDERSNLHLIIGDAAASTTSGAKGAGATAAQSAGLAGSQGSAQNGSAAAGSNNAGAVSSLVLASAIGSSGGILLAGSGAVSTGGGAAGSGSSSASSGSTSSGGSGSVGSTTSAGGSGGGTASVNVVV